MSDSTKILINELTPTSPQWIGAWWLGFLMIVVLALIMTVILALFPAKLRQDHSESEENINKQHSDKQISQSSQIEKDADVLHVNKCDYGKVKDMPKVIYQLLTNATYVAMSCGAATDAFLLAGKFKLLIPSLVFTKFHLIKILDLKITFCQLLSLYYRYGSIFT